jgi:hypothetical protein
VREPTHAERCRTLASQATSATLSTIARDPAGFPYGSLVTIAVDGLGRPLLLLSELAEHTGNLLAQPQASVLLTEPLEGHAQPLAVGRVTVLGPCSRVVEAERGSVRDVFLASSPAPSATSGASGACRGSARTTIASPRRTPWRRPRPPSLGT